MTKNYTSAEMYIGILQIKQAQLLERLTIFKRSMVSENSADKKEKAGAVLSVLDEFVSIVATKHQPSWLLSFQESFRSFCSGTMKPHVLLEFLLDTFGSVRAHDWSFHLDENTPFDFDEIYERYRSQSRIPELFKEILKILEHIRDSDSVDSKSFLDALNKVIATIKVNVKASYFSTSSAWKLLASFCKNYAEVELTKLPEMESVVVELKDTMQECSQEFVKLQDGIQKDMVHVVESNLKGMRQKMDLLLTYENKTALMPDNIKAEDEN